MRKEKGQHDEKPRIADFHSPIIKTLEDEAEVVAFLQAYWAKIAKRFVYNSLCFFFFFHST